jgi:choline dehydrogenase-like flavoprotein
LGRGATQRAAEPDTGVSEVADVLVVGGGAAGAALAWRLSQHGADVLVLEQGDWVASEDIPKRHADWQVRARRYWMPSAARRGWAADYPVRNLGGNPVDSFVYAAVGGSVTGWGGAMWRFVPSDFRAETLDGFGRDWPIGYDDLAPYYAINEAEMGIAGLAGDPTAPDIDALPLPPVSMGTMGDRWMDGFERLGWYWWPQSQAIASRDYRGRPACTNLGHCTFGCPTGSLATPANTYWPAALQGGVRLQTGARVREVTTDTRGRATGVLYHGADGAVHRATAPVVVLACNGLGTPRLLLMSASPAFPDGLANSSGLVGRNLMVHVQTIVCGRFPERTGADHGPWGATATTRHFYETDTSRGFKRGFIITAMRGFTPLDTALQTAGWGEDHHAKLEHHLNHEAICWVSGDDEPEPHNRVELDREHVDAAGLPGVVTHYTLSENSRRIGEEAVARATELCYAAGAESVRSPGFGSLMGWHLLGTARMGSDPSDSVVDAWHACHDVPNLFVVDGSAMTTGASVNPTHTVQAMALRAADGIWDRRADFP